jgi:(p)ppGpp synthase/HD superfamily hydrolase
VDFAYAVAIAARAYGASRNSSGRLFLADAVDVAQALEPGATPIAMSVAVLYRIPEDTEWTAEHLAGVGAEAVVCEAVDVLTRRGGETYMDYVRRVCNAPGASGEAARLVMVADLRLGIAQTDSDALRERYESSLPLLQTALATVG